MKRRSPWIPMSCAHAAEAVQLATKSTEPGDKALMILIAQGWLELAELVETAQPHEPATCDEEKSG